VFPSAADGGPPSGAHKGKKHGVGGTAAAAAQDSRQAETIVISAEKKWLALDPAAGSGSSRTPATLFTLSPQTGFTHQLRLVLQARGHPVVGDSIYGNFALHKHLLSGRPSRMFLHALAVEAFFSAGGQLHSFVASTEELDEHLEEGWRAALRGAVLE